MRTKYAALIGAVAGIALVGCVAMAEHPAEIAGPDEVGTSEVAEVGTSEVAEPDEVGTSEVAEVDAPDVATDDQTRDAAADLVASGDRSEPGPTSEPERVADDATEPVAPVIAPGTAASEWHAMDEGMLICGPYAMPAIDYDPSGRGWWAYCEPALID